MTMRVLMIGSYDVKTYSRGRILYKGLLSQGVDVSLFLRRAGLLGYAALIRRILAKNYAVLLVTGKPLLLIAWLLRWLYRKPIVFDVFISDYSTIVLDRKLVAKNSLTARFIWWSDAIAAKLATVNVLDTKAHIQYFHDEFGSDPSRFRVVYIGSDEDVFSFHPPPANKKIIVYFQGTYIPLHGTDVIVRAAALLKNEPKISFYMVGRGQTYEQTRTLADALMLKNIAWEAFIDLNELPKRMARGDICLGNFGESEKAQQVITHKAFDTISLGRPLITVDTPAHREVFTHGVTALLIPPNNPEALANTIRTLAKDRLLRERIAAQAHRMYVEKYSTKKIGESLFSILQEVSVKGADHTK